MNWAQSASFKLKQGDQNRQLALIKAGQVVNLVVKQLPTVWDDISECTCVDTVQRSLWMNMHAYVHDLSSDFIMVLQTLENSSCLVV